MTERANPDELLEFCRHVLGGGERAARAAAQARRSANGAARLELLAAAAAACRSSAPDELSAASSPDATGGLAGAVRAEVQEANAKLPERQREALALRDALGLHYDELASVMGVDRAAVAPLLARARLRLRAERRGVPAGPATCDERERALRLLALRQDGEDTGAEDAEWLLTHVGECDGCGAAHAAMLEASMVYRAAL